MSMIGSGTGLHEVAPGRQRVVARPLERPLRLQEFIIDAERSRKIKGTEVQYLR